MFLLLLLFLFDLLLSNDGTYDSDDHDDSDDSDDDEEEEEEEDDEDRRLDDLFNVALCMVIFELE